jgi:hypothetical protein
MEYRNRPALDISSVHSLHLSLPSLPPSFRRPLCSAISRSLQRKLAKSLMAIMDAQDTTPDFNPLPVVPGGRQPNKDCECPTIEPARE